MKQLALGLEHVARVCHEANRGYCQTLGDYSQPPWDAAPEWQKESACEGVRHALAGATPEDSHANWMKHKRSEGWVYGPVKDPEAKTHPCMVPYDQLPVRQQRKDRLFLAVVEAFVEDGDA